MTNETSINFDPIDPNDEILKGTPWYSNKEKLGIPPFEDIRSFVQLYMRPRNPNFIQLGDNDDDGGTTYSLPQDSSIVVIGGHFKSGDNSYYSTNYTDELMGNSSTDNEKNYEGFGIKSVDITFDANKIPQITIVFYDLKGNVINNFHSKYAKMFQLPYPKFVLDIKGGFGPLISYKIVKVRDDISIDEMGNYIITSKFIGDRFSPFSDLPLLYLMAVPYLKNKDINSDFVNDNKITSFHELVINSKKLYEKLAQIKESDTEVANQAKFAKKTEELTNYEDALKIYQKSDEFYKLFVDIGGNKDVVLNYIKKSEFDLNNNKIKFIFPPVEFTIQDAANIKTIVENTIKAINDPTQVITYGEAATSSYVYVSEIDYSLLVTAIKNVRNDILSQGLNNSQENLIKISQIPNQVLGETRLTIGNIFRILIEDYNYLMNRIFEEGNKGYQEIITNNTNRTQQKFDKMGFPTVIQGNQIIYPGVIPEFQKWPEIIFIEQFIDAYYRANKDKVISDTLLNKEEDGRQKYIPINPREYYKSNLKEPVVENIFYNKQLVDIYKLIYQRFLCFANINIDLNINQSVYSTWTGSEDEEKDWLAWTKDFLGLVDFSDVNIQKGLFYSIINMEARNIAYAISLNDDYKKSIKNLSKIFNDDYINNNTGSELAKSIEAITNNALSIQNINNTPTTPLVLAPPPPPTQTNNLGLQLGTTPQIVDKNSIQPLDDNYVIVTDIAPTEIGKEVSTSPDYITQYMLKLNEANSGYKITRDNILYIPDKKLGGGNNQSDYYFESNNADDELNILTNLVVDDDSQAFNFKKFKDNCSYTGLIQIPKGMLIILANLLRSKETVGGQVFTKYDNGEYTNIPIVTQTFGGFLPASFTIRKNSIFYNYLQNLYTEAYLPDKGFSINFINDKGKKSVVVRKDLAGIVISETEKDLIEKVKKYLYEPLYISINDIRFVNFKNTIIKNGITNTIDSKPTLYKQYLKLLLNKITKFADEDTKKLDDKLKSFTSYLKDPQVKLSVYKSFQVIYENYLHGVQKKDFEQVVSRDKNTSTFLFVDRGYNDISDLCILDIKTLLNDANDYEVSLFSSMARLLADNNFWFYPFQNFLTTENDYKDLFKINFDKKGKTKPKFVAMYVGGLSSNPNSPITSPIQDDGIKKDKIPFDLTTSTSGTGLNAFLVKYTGIQNQSVFSNLQVSTESLKNTDEGLRIQSEIIRDGSNSFSIPKGQSLLNVYQKQSYSSTIKIPFGNVAIQPTQYYYQEYIPLFDGLYIIYNVTHNMDAETQRLETTFKGYRLKRDVNPIVTQEFVDFLSDDIYTQTLNDLSIFILTSGPKLAPIRDLIAKFESNGDYEIYNFGKDGGGGIRSITRGSKDAVKLTDKTINQIIGYQNDANFNLFAVGKYQTIPETLNNLTKKLNRDTTKFDVNTQDTLCDSLLLDNNNIGNYLNGKNNGEKSDLENAIQAIAKIWAAMPVINSISGGNKKNPPIKGNFGDVETGIGSTGYYGGVGINLPITKVGVNSVVQALITSRIQQCGVKPKFIPTYYSDVTNSGTIPNNDAKFVTIGDSLSQGLTLYTKKIVDIKTPVPLTFPGKDTQWLLNKCNGIQPKRNIPNLVLSIGANDLYEITNVDKLITAINITFPDSKKFIINGSYGWDNLKITNDRNDEYWKNKINTFMSKFSSKDYIVLGEIVKRTGHPQGKKGDTFFDPIIDDLKYYGL
jgi:hypothetical protein